jgi:tetratricopeptide (TPR) repeat protein
VLGGIGVGGGNVSPGSVILTAPSILAFYLRQTFFPVWIGPSYPLRQVTLANLGLANFVVPVLVLAVATAAYWALARRDRVRLLGGAIWLLFLLPALNIGAFQGERLAHDRYLYLPLLGAIMVAVSAVAAGLRRAAGMAGGAADGACLAAAAALAVPLGVRTYRYNDDWLSQVALGEAMVRSDPGSVMNHTLLGTAFHEAGAYDKAIAAFDRGLEIHPWYYAALFRARSLIEARRYEEAERALEKLIAESEQDDEAYELLCDALVRHGRLERAEAVFREARANHPQFKCRFTSGLAMILEATGRRDEALAEMELVRGGVGEEYSAPAAILLFQLGTLYQKLGRPDDARGALQEYLDRSASFPDPRIQEARQQAERALRRLAR